MMHGRKNIKCYQLLCYRLTHSYILYMSKHFGMANTKCIASQASGWFYYKEICYDAWSHERKKMEHNSS